MEGFFKNRYKTDTIRLSDWDYSFDGFYFVTICAKGRRNYFGQVRKGIMGLNVLGCIIWNEWYKTRKIRKNIRLDEFIVMPNHLHGVIEICNKNCRDEAPPRLYNGDYPQMSKISPKSGSLSSIIGSFKSICTKRIRKINPQFSWQPRFYEHIVRIDTESLEKIRYYIKFNPAYWDKDRNNPVNF